MGRRFEGSALSWHISLAKLLLHTPCGLERPITDFPHHLQAGSEGNSRHQGVMSALAELFRLDFDNEIARMGNVQNGAGALIEIIEI